MARETKLDDLVEKRICDALSRGHSWAAAARAGGISEACIHEWRQRGRSGEPRFVEFLERVDRAEHVAEARAIEVLTSKFDSPDESVSLRAAQWWLERRRAEDWGAKKGDEGAKLPTDEECLAMVRKVREAKAG
jgi:hypothetical protein